MLKAATRKRRTIQILATIGLLSLLTGLAAAAAPATVSTFECISVYWKPPDASASRTCTVQYREAGTGAWKHGQALYFNPRTDGPAGHLEEYRGSIVNLKPGTTYEIQLTVEGTGTTATVNAATWSESFPVGTTVNLPANSSSTLDITQSGSPSGYRLYTHAPGQTATIDVNDGHDNCIVIDASYIILRGLTLKDGRINGIYLDENAHDIVIEECDISGWGRIDASGWGENHNSAIRAKSHVPGLKRIVVQRNRIHHPRSDSNAWDEDHGGSFHPKGPQATSWYNSGGNHVIRYNHVWSDDDHKYNDILGGGTNSSFEGFPNRDSDIYGNILQNCWDDAIESEGANMNVRIWGNYVDQSFQTIATRGTSMGPLYMWRNVTGESKRYAATSTDDDERGFLHKAGELNGSGDYGVFVYHNTMLQPVEPGNTHPLGGRGGLEGRMQHTTTRNNILHGHLSTGFSIRVNAGATTNDFDYDLYNGDLIGAVDETNGILGVPAYDPAPSCDAATGRGTFTLAASSPGRDDGAVLPNFNEGYTGSAPDMGAHEAGAPPMQFGPAAYTEGPAPLELAAPRAGAPVAIDGNLAEYAAAPAVLIADNSGRGADDNSLTAAVLWDANFLYIAYDVSDTKLNAIVTAAGAGKIWEDDTLEVYVDRNNDHGPWQGADDYHFFVNLNGIEDDTGAGWNASEFQSAVVLVGTLGNDADTDTGYRIEVAVAWSALGGAPAAGERIGIDLCGGDKDTGDGYQFYDWAQIQPFQQPALWGDLILDDSDPDPDGDGMPTVWEQLHGLNPSDPSDASDHSDGDEYSALEEYVMGGNPQTGDAPWFIIGEESGGMVISFEALEAAGTGYDGMTRHYALEKSSDLAPGSWSIVAGMGDVAGEGQFVTHPVVTGVRAFYRFVVWLTVP